MAKYKLCTKKEKQNINPMIAEKKATQRSKDYMNVRRVSKELVVGYEEH